MEDLLIKNLIAYYSLPTPTIVNWLLQTKEIYFEIEDTNAGEIILHTTRGSGMAKFTNQDDLEFTIINYDKFISSIQDETFKNGRERCDILYVVIRIDILF